MLRPRCFIRTFSVASPAAVFVLSTCGIARATINSTTSFRVTFASTQPTSSCEPRDTPEVAWTWSPTARITSTGLRLESGDEGWLESDAIPSSDAYRSPYFVGVTCTPRIAAGEPEGIVVRVRYGCDRVKWSPWRALDKGASADSWGSMTCSGSFCGFVSQPREELELARELSAAWHSDVPKELCGSEAYCRWVLDRHPDYFDKVIPAIGYIQIRIENQGKEPVHLWQVAGWTHTTTSGINYFPEKCGYGRDQKWTLNRRQTPSAQFRSTTQPALQR